MEPYYKPVSKQAVRTYVQPVSKQAVRSRDCLLRTAGVLPTVEAVEAAGESLPTREPCFPQAHSISISPPGLDLQKIIALDTKTSPCALATLSETRHTTSHFFGIHESPVSHSLAPLNPSKKQGAPPAEQSPQGSPFLVRDVLTTREIGAPPAQQPPKWSPFLLRGVPATREIGAPPAQQPPQGSPFLLRNVLTTTKIGAPPAQQPLKGSPFLLRYVPTTREIGAPPAQQSPKGSPFLLRDVLTTREIGAPPGQQSPKGSPFLSRDVLISSDCSLPSIFSPKTLRSSLGLLQHRGSSEPGWFSQAKPGDLVSGDTACTNTELGAESTSAGALVTGMAGGQPPPPCGSSPPYSAAGVTVGKRRSVLIKELATVKSKPLPLLPSGSYLRRTSGSDPMISSKAGEQACNIRPDLLQAPSPLTQPQARGPRGSHSALTSPSADAQSLSRVELPLSDSGQEVSSAHNSGHEISGVQGSGSEGSFEQLQGCPRSSDAGGGIPLVARNSNRLYKVASRKSLPDISICSAANAAGSRDHGILARHQIYDAPDPWEILSHGDQASKLGPGDSGVHGGQASKLGPGDSGAHGGQASKLGPGDSGAIGRGSSVLVSIEQRGSATEGGLPAPVKPRLSVPLVGVPGPIQQRGSVPEGGDQVPLRSRASVLGHHFPGDVPQVNSRACGNTRRRSSLCLPAAASEPAGTILQRLSEILSTDPGTTCSHALTQPAASTSPTDPESGKECQSHHCSDSPDAGASTVPVLPRNGLRTSLLALEAGPVDAPALSVLPRKGCRASQLTLEAGPVDAPVPSMLPRKGRRASQLTLEAGPAAGLAADKAKGLPQVPVPDESDPLSRLEEFLEAEEGGRLRKHVHVGAAFKVARLAIVAQKKVTGVDRMMFQLQVATKGKKKAQTRRL
eukprot:gene20327-27085_t